MTFFLCLPSHLGCRASCEVRREYRFSLLRPGQNRSWIGANFGARSVTCQVLGGMCRTSSLWKGRSPEAQAGEGPGRGDEAAGGSPSPPSRPVGGKPPRLHDALLNRISPSKAVSRARGVGSPRGHWDWGSLLSPEAGGSGVPANPEEKDFRDSHGVSGPSGSAPASLPWPVFRPPPRGPAGPTRHGDPEVRVLAGLVPPEALLASAAPVGPTPAAL